MNNSISINDLKITEQQMINRDSGYADHVDGRSFYFEYYMNPVTGRKYRAMPTETSEGEPIMDADWISVEF